MKAILLSTIFFIPLVLTGCSSKAGTATVGAIGGAAAGGGAYEYHLHREMQRIEEDHKAGKMDDREYQIRKDEVQRLELIK